MKPIKVKTKTSGERKTIRFKISSPPQYRWKFKIYRTRRNIPAPVQNNSRSSLDYTNAILMSVCFILSLLFFLLKVLLGD